MPVVKTESVKASDVVKWVVNETFCYETVSMNNGDVALAINANICGKLAVYLASAWKILDDSDVITTASIICPIVSTKTLTAAAAGDAVAIMPKCVILRRGPAVVMKEELSFEGAVEATCITAMLALGILTVNELGAQYVNFAA